MIIKKNIREQSIFYLILISIGLIYLAHAIYYPGLFDGGDGLAHYLISRYSWDHPLLFMHLWGKPFFTLVSSPFSQFGLIGIKIFNISCALLSCICIFHIAKKLKMQRPLLAPLFLGFTVLYFFMSISGYTEMLFGLIVVFCILLFLKEKYILSTILISFLPMVRSEGYLILPLFFLILIIKRKYLYVALLATGNLLYSLLGYFIYDDLLWLHNQNPYKGDAADIYGHGNLSHFIRAYWMIWGEPLTLLVLAGLLFALINIFRKKSADTPVSKLEIILIYGSLIIYFCAHSVFWWKGLFNSLGLIRVLGAVLPLSALVSLRGFNLMLGLFSRYKILSKAIMVVIIILVIITPFNNAYFPLKSLGEDLVTLDVKEWFENSGLKKDNYKIYYLHPNFPIELSFDPYDKNTGDQLWNLYTTIIFEGYDALPDCTLVIWDGHYGPNEGRIPLKKIMSDKYFTLIKSFYPKVPFLVLGDIPFEIHVFKKQRRDENSLKFSERKYDFETTDRMTNINTLSDDYAFSGSWSCKLNETTEFSVTIVETINSIADIENNNFIRLSFKILGSGQINSNAVLSLHNNDKQISYYSTPVNLNLTDKNKWEDFDCTWLINKDLFKQSKIIKVYILNNNKQIFYVDDFILKFSNNYN